MEKLPEGFSIPLHRSITEPIMMAGVPRNIAIINGIATIACILGAHNLWVIPLGMMSHTILVALHRRDKAILSVLKRNIAKPGFLRG